MHKIDFYFVGGTQMGFTDVCEEVTDKIVAWLDDKENTKTFQINTPKQNTSCIIRKELVLFVNIV